MSTRLNRRIGRKAAIILLLWALLSIVLTAAVTAQTSFQIPPEYDKYRAIEDTTMLSDIVTGRRFLLTDHSLSRSSQLELYSIEHLGWFPQLQIDSAGTFVPLRRLNNTLQQIFLAENGYLDDFGIYLKIEAEAMEAEKHSKNTQDEEADVDVSEGEVLGPVYYVTETAHLESSVLNMAHNILTLSEDYAYFHSVHSETAPGSSGSRYSHRVHALDINSGNKLGWTDLFKPDHMEAVRNWMLEYPPFNHIKQRGLHLLDSTDFPFFSVGPVALDLFVRVCRSGDCPEAPDTDAPFEEYDEVHVTVPLVLLQEHLNDTLFASAFIQADRGCKGEFRPQLNTALPFPFSLLMLDANHWVWQLSDAPQLRAQLEEWLSEPGLRSVRLLAPDGSDTMRINFDRQGHIERLSVWSEVHNHHPFRFQRRDLAVEHNPGEYTDFTIYSAEAKEARPQSDGVPVGWARAYASQPVFVSNVRLNSQVIVGRRDGTMLSSHGADHREGNMRTTIKHNTDADHTMEIDSVFAVDGTLRHTIRTTAQSTVLTHVVQHKKDMPDDTLSTAVWNDAGELTNINAYFAGRGHERHNYAFEYRDDGLITAVRPWWPESDRKFPPQATFEYNSAGRLISINKRLKVVYEYR